MYCSNEKLFYEKLTSSFEKETQIQKIETAGDTCNVFTTTKMQLIPFKCDHFRMNIVPTRMNADEKYKLGKSSTRSPARDRFKDPNTTRNYWKFLIPDETARKRIWYPKLNCKW